MMFSEDLCYTEKLVTKLEQVCEACVCEGFLRNLKCIDQFPDLSMPCIADTLFEIRPIGQFGTATVSYQLGQKQACPVSHGERRTDQKHSFLL